MQFGMQNRTSRQFQHIYDYSACNYPGVGILTASNRDVWSKVNSFPLHSDLLFMPDRLGLHRATGLTRERKDHSHDSFSRLRSLP